MAAVLKHDPGGAPLAAAFRYTENAIDVRAGEGIWKTASALGAVQRRYVDPVNGMAAYFGLIQEGGDGGVATMRIKVVDRRITEGELVIGRKATGVYSPEGLIAEPPADRPLAGARRTSRGDLVNAANSYFEGLQLKSRDTIKAQVNCMRVENGVKMTGVRPGRGQGAAPVDAGDCANVSGISQIAEVINRRFPVVDEEAGVVVGMAVFTRPPGARRANGTLWPRNLLTEIFTVENGQIRTIHAAMHYLEPEVPTAPGWTGD